MCLLQNAANQNICTQSLKRQILFSEANNSTIGISDTALTYYLMQGLPSFMWQEVFQK